MATFKRGVHISHLPKEEAVKKAIENTDPNYYLVYLDGFYAQESSWRSFDGSLPWGHREGNLEITVGEVTRVFGYVTKDETGSQFKNPEKFRNQLLFVGSAKELAKAVLNVRVIESDQEDRTVLDNTAVILDQFGGVVKANAPAPYNTAGDALNLLAIGARIASILSDDDLELDFRGRVPFGGVEAPVFPGAAGDKNQFVIRRDLDKSQSKGEIQIRFRLYTLPKPDRSGTTVANVRVSLEEIHLPGTSIGNPDHNQGTHRIDYYDKYFKEVGFPGSKNPLRIFSRRVHLDNLELVAESSFGGGRSPITSEYKAYLAYKGQYFLPDLVGIQYVPLFNGLVDPYSPLPFSISATYHKNYEKLKQVLEQFGQVQAAVTDITKTVNAQRQRKVSNKIARLNAIEAEAKSGSTPATVTHGTAPAAAAAGATPAPVLAAGPNLTARSKKLKKLQKELAQLQSPSLLEPYLPAIIGSAQPIRNIVSEFLPDVKTSFTIHHFLQPWELLELPTSKLGEKEAVGLTKYSAPTTFWLTFDEDKPEHLTKTQPTNPETYWLKLKVEIDTIREDPERQAERLGALLREQMEAITKSTGELANSVRPQN